MAEQVEEIAVILTQMKEEAEKNAEGFNKLLTTINNRIEIMENDTESEDLIKVYLTELKKVLEDRHSLVVSEFEKITQSFKTLSEEQEKLPKNDNFREMFDVFTGNMQSIAKELSDQKNLFATYNENFEKFVADKTNRNDIINSVEAIKKDVEAVNQDFENSIGEINTNIQSIFKNLVVMDPTAQNDIVRREIENVYLATNAILTALHAVEQKNDDLLNNINRFITRENFEQSQQKIDSLIEKTDNIPSLFNDISRKTDIDQILYKTSELGEKLNTLSSKEDLKYFAEKADEISGKITFLPQTSNIDSIPQRTVEGLQNKFDNLATKEDLERVVQKSDEVMGKFEPLAEKSDFDNVLIQTNQISEKMESLTRKEDLSDIKNQNISIETKIEQLPQMSDYTSLYNNIHEFSTILDALRNSLSSSNEQTSKMIREQLEKLESTLSAVVTENDFDGFRHDLAEFIQKIIDNSNALNENLSTNKETLSTLIDKIEKLDISNDLASISDAINNLKNNSQSNLDTIVGEINNISGKIDFEPLMSNFENLQENLSKTADEIKNNQNNLLEKLSENTDDEKFQSVNNNIDYLRETVLEVQNSNDATFAEKLIAIRDMINSGVSTRDEKFSEIQGKLDNLIADFTRISNDNSGKIDFSTNEISNLKTAVEEISKGYNEWNYNQDNRDSKLVNTISSELAEITTSLSSLQDEIQAGIHTEVSAKIDNLDNKISETTTAVNSIKDELLEKLSSQNNDSELRTISTEINTIKEAINSSNDFTENIFREKLLSLREIISNGVDSSDSKFGIIQEKIDAFLNNYEKIANDTEIKIGSSMSEVSNIKVEMENISKSFNEWNFNQDERDSKLASIISNELGEITTTLTSLQDEIQAGLHQEISKNTEAVENRFNNILENLETFKNDILSKDDENEQYNFADSFKEVKDKITTIKQEINLVNTDIVDIISSKAESIIAELMPLKSAIDSLDGIRNNLTEDFDDLKQAFDFGGVRNSINEVKDLINQKFNEQSELLNMKDFVSATAKDVTSELGEKITSSAEEIKTLLNVAVNNDNLTWTIDEMKADLSDRVSRIYDEVTKEKNDNTSILTENTEKILAKTEELSDGNTKISGLLDILNQKVDVLAMADDGDDYSILDEIDEVKGMISNQRSMLENTSSAEKISAVEKTLEDLVSKIETIETTDLKDMRESILTTILGVFEQISFIEESEDIKDFVEEKTDAINQSLIEVKQQLKQIANVDDSYSYSLQDVESDIAKLRLILNDMSSSTSNETELSDISDNIHRIVSSVEELQNSLTQEQMSELKNDFERLSEDVLSISSRTNKLLLTSDESYNALNNGLNDFSDVINKLEERINHFDNKEISERIEEKLDSTYNLVANSANSDKVMRQALMYMGEWIDTTSENLESLCEKTEQITDVKEIIEELENNMPQHADMLKSLEARFDEQQDRMDRLEMKLEKIISAIEDLDDNALSKKITKMEKQLTKLGNSVEKLASYVDE